MTIKTTFYIRKKHLNIANLLVMYILQFILRATSFELGINIMAPPEGSNGPVYLEDGACQNADFEDSHLKFIL